jgi:hypothetical protein
MRSTYVMVLAVVLASCTSKLEEQKSQSADTGMLEVRVPTNSVRPVDDTARNRTLTYCQVHGDSLVWTEVRADFLVGVTQDPKFMEDARRLFPNTRNVLLPNGGDKGTMFKRCPSCDSAMKAWLRRE